jgi:hypothetical protein
VVLVRPWRAAAYPLPRRSQCGTPPTPLKVNVGGGRRCLVRRGAVAQEVATVQTGGERRDVRPGGEGRY